MSDSLSQDDINDLLGSISEGDEDQSQENDVIEEEPSAPLIKLYDFKRPQVFSARVIEEISRIMERTAQTMSDSLSRDFSAEVEIELASIDQLSFEEFTRSIPNPCQTVCFRDSHSGQGFVMELDPSAALAIVDLQAGGMGNGKVDKIFLKAPLAQRGLWGIMKEWKRIFQKSWAPFCLWDFEWVDQVQDVRHLRSLPLREMVLLASMNIRIGQVEAMVNYCLPQKLLEPLFSVQEGTEDISGAKVIHQSMDSLKHSVRFSLPAQTMTLEQLTALQQGDILSVDSAGALYQQNHKIRDIAYKEQAQGLLLNLPLDHRLSKIKKPLKISIGRKKNTAIRQREASSKKEIFYYFTWVQSMHLQKLHQILQQDHPQIACALVYWLPPALAVSLLERFSRDQRNALFVGIAGIPFLDTKALYLWEKELVSRLYADVSCTQPHKFSRTYKDGMDCLTTLLKEGPPQWESEAVHLLEEKAPQQAEALKISLFEFTDILNLHDRQLQKLLREVDGKVLMQAIAPLSSEEQQSIFRNMSKRASAMIQEDLSYSSPILHRQALESQKQIIAVLRKLEEAGEIVIPRAGDQWLELPLSEKGESHAESE